jgi:tetratricopeptide (TPR) repeat protein
MSKRLAMLQSMTESGSTDPFAWYGLAMEYKNLGRPEEAAMTFERLRALDPNYLPAYHMGGTVLVELERVDDAKACLQRGLELALEKGDHKTHSEIQAILDEVSG